MAVGRHAVGRAAVNMAPRRPAGKPVVPRANYPGGAGLCACGAAQRDAEWSGARGGVLDANGCVAVACGGTESAARRGLDVPVCLFDGCERTAARGLTVRADHWRGDAQTRKTK